jgi:nucleoid DNA-binding protein
MAALTKAEMAEALFDQLGLNKREARELVDLFFEEIRAALSSGEQVKLSGIGAPAATRRPAKKFPSAHGASSLFAQAKN